MEYFISMNQRVLKFLGGLKKTSTANEISSFPVFEKFIYEQQADGDCWNESIIFFRKSICFKLHF